MFGDDPFLEPSHGFPSLELDHDLVGHDVLVEVEEDLALDRIAREVEGSIDGDEGGGH